MSSNPSEIVAIVKDDGLIVAPNLQQKDSTGSTESSIRIPAVDTGLGADFGEDITDDNRYFAATREPIAGFLIYGIANHIVDKWFTINDVTTSSPDPELDHSIQKELRKIKYKKILRELIEYERLYGKALLVA